MQGEKHRKTYCDEPQKDKDNSCNRRHRLPSTKMTHYHMNQSYDRYTNYKYTGNCKGNSFISVNIAGVAVISPVDTNIRTKNTINIANITGARHTARKIRIILIKIPIHATKPSPIL